MQKLTRKPFLNTLVVAAFLLTGKVGAQTTGELLDQVGHLINDALFYSNKYVTPITDAAIYQSASGWVTTPKSRKLWDVSLAFHANVFYTPHHDRTFVINNSDLSFFQLEQGTSATVPTALGNDYQVYLSGMLGDSKVRLKTPEGIDMNVVAYPYLQGAIGLWKGTDVVVKYSPKIDLKHSDYQVYGFGVKHNLSQYIKGLEAKKVYLAALVAYSKEDVSFNFLDVTTDYGTLGITMINGLVDTWQFQVNASKEIGRFELMGGVISSVSDVKYKVKGDKGSVEDVIPLQQILNKKLEALYKTRINYVGEAAVKYNIGNFSVQGIVAFGKFINTNFSLEYNIN